MSGPTPPGTPPPEVPEEFAAAYWAAYEQALADQTDGPQHREHPVLEPPDPESAGSDEADPDAAQWAPDTQDLPVRRGPLRIGTHRSVEQPFEEYDDTPTWFERVRDSAWFVPILLALLALLLILGAYVVGRRFAGEVSAAEPDSRPGIVLEEGAGRQPVTNQTPAAGAWGGNVSRLEGVRATTECTGPSGLDASGRRVGYDADNLTDGIAGTTWRCDGPAIGETIELDLGREVPVAQVGLIPGYAKTDEQSKADRYAENNRVTRVRWTIGDTELVQAMNGSPRDRSLQVVRVPRTTTDSVELEILAVRKGPRDTTAISEIEVARAP